jgi:hypothetical protein
MKTLVTAKDRFLTKVFAVYHQINVFEDKFEATHSLHYQDSAIKYNDSLLELLSSENLGSLSLLEQRKLKDSTKITISQSKDQKITVLSWCIFNKSPTAMCSNIAVAENVKPVVLSRNGSTVDSGYNIQVDTIIKLVYKERPLYLLIGSNKCGNLCLDYLAALYSLNKGIITSKQEAFYDGKNYSDEVLFNYLINEKIKSEPKFQVKHNLLVCPIFSDDRTKKIGNKTYKIVGGKAD